MHASTFIVAGLLSLASALPIDSASIGSYIPDLTKGGVINPNFKVPEGHQLVNINGTWAFSDFGGSHDMAEIVQIAQAGLKELGLDKMIHKRNNGECQYKPGQCDESLGYQEYCVSLSSHAFDLTRIELDVAVQVAVLPFKLVPQRLHGLRW
jgi:hypothetical protein